MFSISTFFAMLNVSNWRFTIAPITVVVILISLMMLGAGEFLVHLIYYKHKQYVPYMSPQKPIGIPFWVIFLLCSFLGVLLLHYYNETVRIAKYYGYTDGPLLLSYARQAIKDPEVNRDKIASLGTVLAKSSAYIFSFVFLYNAVFFKKNKIGYFLPVLIGMGFFALSAGRTEFIYLVMLWVVIGGVFFMQKRQWKQRYNLKIVKFAFWGMILFLALFVFVGSFRNAKILEMPFVIISNYIGQSIPLLDDFILHPRPPDTYFGENTLFGIYGLLRKFGFDYPFFYAPYDFTDFNNLHGNVYSIIRRYLEDFGYFGLFSLMFSLGFFYSLLFFMVRRTRDIRLLLYASIFYPIVEIAIEERFFMSVVGSGTVYIFILLSIFYFLFVNRKYLNEAIDYLFGLKSKN
jgi:oligosaccharide repeat unit polymerase